MRRVLTFFKQDVVLCVALALAAGSMLLVPPGPAYRDYVDVRTLAILFCLMCVMAGLQKLGVFARLAHGLLSRVKSGLGVILTLVLLCFFSSMVITNDVALITFVPFAFTVLDLLGREQRQRLLLWVVVLQTIAANLGSMLTPIGNPQNLYLYGKAGLSLGAFVALMLPYTLLALALLAVGCLALGQGCPPVPKGEEAPERPPIPAGLLWLYLALFALSLLAVGRILPWQGVLAVTALAVLLVDRRVLGRVDYALLLTFVGFFIFIGNLGQLPAFRDFLRGIIAGRETFTAIVASQVISNVPAALLLSGFTENIPALIIGVNLGGLGTLIASMASLISYKQIAKDPGVPKGRYIARFTAANLGFLAALAGLYVLMGA